ncbi:uncharacterized protein LOC135212537 [Macrobrachium nipponense]|uniref:uncharacterized protein LOC135212537 n=1 Tax=Macrobrachium nipponense TaxID=159736 RepID=UPI0030C7B98E
MKGVLLAFFVCCAAVAVVYGTEPDIRRISILEILQNNPALREELSAKIKAKQDTPDETSTAPAGSAAPAAGTAKSAAAASTTTPAPQADSPPEVPAETTTPAAEEKTNGRPIRRRRPVVAESEKFSDAESGHRLRVVPNGNAEDKRQNGRRFPGTS